MTDETKPTSQPESRPQGQPEPVRGPASGIPVPDSAVERHLREAADHVKPAEEIPKKRPSADRDEIARPWKPEE